MLNQRQSVIIGSAGLVFFVCDRIIKYLLVITILSPSGKGIFNYMQNTGISFGLKLFQGKNFITILFILIIVLILSYLVVNSMIHKIIPRALALWIILLGASSNLLDRLRHGAVIDYIDFKIWPVFNIADIMIVAGVGLLILEILKREKNSGVEDEK